MHSPKGKLDPLAHCSYLALKYKNVVFSQQKSTFFKTKTLTSYVNKEPKHYQQKVPWKNMKPPLR